MAIALAEQPTLAASLAAIRPGWRLPEFAWGTPGTTCGWERCCWPCRSLPLEFLGNALIAITEENNRLFPDRPVTERKVAFSTGVMNAFSSAIGGILRQPRRRRHGRACARFGVQPRWCLGDAGALPRFRALFFGEAMLTLFRLPRRRRWA